MRARHHPDRGRPARHPRLRLGVSPQTPHTPPHGEHPVPRHRTAPDDGPPPRPPCHTSQRRPARHYPRLQLRTPLEAGPTGLSPASPLRRPAHTTTSADFCPSQTRTSRSRAVDAAPPQHNRHPGRPPRIRTTNVPLHPPHLRNDPVDGDDFTFLSRLTQTAPPSTRFVFLGAEVRLGLPSHPASRRRSRLRLGVSTTSSSRGLPPPIDRPCRAYSSAPPGGGASLLRDDVVRWPCGRLHDAARGPSGRARSWPGRRLSSARSACTDRFRVVVERLEGVACLMGASAALR